MAVATRDLMISLSDVTLQQVAAASVSVHPDRWVNLDTTVVSELGVSKDLTMGPVKFTVPVNDDPAVQGKDRGFGLVVTIRQQDRLDTRVREYRRLITVTSADPSTIQFSTKLDAVVPAPVPAVPVTEAQLQTAVTTQVNATARDAVVSALAAQKGVANGVAGLDGNALVPVASLPSGNGGVLLTDSNGLIPTSSLPPLATTEIYTVASDSAMTGLTAQPGDMAVRTDQKRSYILRAAPASTLSNWQELLTPTDAVTSVAGKVGAVTLGAGDIVGGTFAAAQIPSLPASQINSGTLDTARIPSLDAAKIGSGTLNLARIPTMDAAHIPALDASAISTGVLDPARLPAASTSTSGAMTSDQVNALNSLNSDTGWVTLPLLNSWTASGISGYVQGAKYRKSGNSIEVRSSIKVASGNGANSVFYTLPSGCRPANKIFAFGGISGGLTDAYIGTDGTVFSGIGVNSSNGYLILNFIFTLG